MYINNIVKHRYFITIATTMEDSNKRDKKNRDKNRCNNVHATVQGCMYADISAKCIDKLISDCNASNEDKMSSNQKRHLLDIVKDSTSSSKKLFVKSQNSIAKHASMRYAKDQLNQLQ